MNALWKTIREDLLRHPKQTMEENEIGLTFEEAAVYAEGFAKRLDGQACCAILCSSELATAIGLLSCFAAGVTAVPLSIRYGKQHCMKILDFICPDCLITDAGGCMQVLYLDPDGFIPPKEHPALIMCTSGTTGTPKGVMLSEENILANVRDIASYFALKQQDILLIARPLYHCAVLTGEFLTSIRHGSGIRFRSAKFQPKELIDTLVKTKATVFCGTPTMLYMMTRFLRPPTSLHLRHIAVSGECMSESIGKALRETFPAASIYHVYGLTEACPRVSYLPPALFHAFPDSVGVPLESVSVRLVKNDIVQKDVNSEGVLWVKGPNVMLGYYKNPELTQRVLRDGWLCTGDLAQLNAYGLLKIKGRNDDLIIRAGMNIYPQEIEAALKTDPRTKEVLAYGYGHRSYGTQIGLKIAGAFTNEAEVRSLCEACLPPYQMPSRIELVNELPKNASGKILRKCAEDAERANKHDGI